MVTLGKVWRARRARPEARRPAVTSVLVAHPSADLYGSDRVLLESVSAMVGRGWQVQVTVPAPGPLVAELTGRGAQVELCRVPVLRKSALRPSGLVRFVLEVVQCLPRCWRLIRRSRASRIYVNTITIPTWILLGRLLGRAVTCHVHEAEGSAPLLVRRLLAVPLLLAEQIIVNSTFSRDVLSGAIPLLRRRATVVYNGIPGPVEAALARPKPHPPLTLLFLGRLSPRKGPQVAIAATAELRRRGVEVRLDLLGGVFAGYEWFEAELHSAVAAAGLQGSVRFLGFDADVWPHLAAADVVLVPSVVDEPFGNTAVEAVLAARPLVVSATSGLLEASAGFSSVQSVPPEQPDLLAAAVQRVLADWPGYRAAAWSDAALARDRHSVRRYQHRVIEVLEQGW